MSESVKNFVIGPDMTVKQAMRQMGRTAERILFVADKKRKLLGSLTDGDIRRWVLNEGKLSAAVMEVCNRKPLAVHQAYDMAKVKRLMLQQKIVSIPVVDEKGAIADVLLWDRILGRKGKLPKGKIDLPVVIMAGGKGARLDPFTRILPKPLIPIGDKAIIEIIMDKFSQYGVRHFYLCTYHRSKMIRAYFEELENGYDVEFIEEKTPLGTAGGLRLIQNKIKGPLILSNCDIIIEANYHEIVSHHLHDHNDITIVGSFRHFTIPYGICHIAEGGRLVNIEEKPEYDFLVNTGMYVIQKKVLKLIPQGKIFHMTDLVEKVREEGGRVGVFPVDEKAWIDVGQWEEYRQSIRSLEVSL